MNTYGPKREQRYTILVADDSEMNRAILRSMLEESYDIIEAEDGLQAVSILQQMEQEISLVLLDIVMPNLDGFGVLSAMNKYNWIDSVPVIMISAESTHSFIERAYDMGVTDYISRPFDMMVVRRRSSTPLCSTPSSAGWPPWSMSRSIRRRRSTT